MAKGFMPKENPRSTTLPLVRVGDRVYDREGTELVVEHIEQDAKGRVFWDRKGVYFDEDEVVRLDRTIWGPR